MTYWSDKEELSVPSGILQMWGDASVVIVGRGAFLEFSGPNRTARCSVM